MPKFTDMLLKSLKPKTAKYQIRENTGFAVRVMPTGSKTFLFIYETSGKRKELNLGAYPYTGIAEARTKYNDAAKLWEHGIDPKLEASKIEQEKPIPEKTVADLIIDYISWSKVNHIARWAEDKERTLNYHLLPKIGSKLLSSVKRRDIIQMMEDLRISGIKQGGLRNAFRAGSAMFAYAQTMDLVEVSPFLATRRALPYVTVKDRTRALSEKEIKIVWEGITHSRAYEVSKQALKLVLVLAQRPGEICAMHWSEVEGRWWTIPPEKAKKGGRYHRVYLSDTAVSLMGERTEGYVFPSPKISKGSSLSITTIQGIARREKGVPSWTPHDLRRTARTHMARLGIPEEHAEAILNHAKKGMVKVYNQYGYDLEKKEALLRWEAELLRIIQ